MPASRSRRASVPAVLLTASVAAFLLATLAQPVPASTPTSTRRIAVVIDVSPAHQAVMPAVRARVQEAIENLRPTQSFQVVAAGRDGAVVTSPPAATTRASVEVKVAGIAFLGELQATAGKDLTPALTTAFAARPDYVYLLTDGRSDVPAAAAKLRELNPDRGVKVNVLVFATEPPPKATLDALGAMAKENRDGTLTVSAGEATTRPSATGPASRP